MQIQPSTRHVWLSLVPLLVASACNSRAGAPVGAGGVSLVVSGDTAGWIAPCACSARQSGGLARRATFVEKCRKTDDVVPLDVGGAPSGTSAYDVAKFAVMLRGEVAMDTAAHNIGAAEAALGPDSLRALAAETGIAWVAANANDASEQPIAPAVRIVEAGGRRLAIVGVLSTKFATADVHVDDPAAAVLRALATVAGRYDAAVVLAYLPTEELEALAKSLPEVDLVVGGPTLQTLEPRQVGPTMVAAVTNKGKFMARFSAPRGTKSGSWRCEIVELDADFADDPWQLANLEGYREMLLERDFAPSETSFAPQLPDRLPQNYQIAGSAACQTCHEGDCTLWQGSKHAAAWATLEAGSSHGDPFCQQCHTTGYGLPGGFASLATGAERVAVGCESCHGPAQAHSLRPQIPTTYVAHDQCLRCHDRENSPAFAYAGYWQQIRHGQESTARRAQISPEEIVP
jgi:hypothetical protein